jgi:hypothetical protein
MRKFAVVTLMMLALGACANQGLRQVQNVNADGPDEFFVEPKSPLQQPPNYAALPTPTPGSANLTDQSPVQDAAIAVGGRPQSAAGPIPASDGALVTAASRFGVSPDIRSSLAASDAEFRKRQARFTQIRFFPVDRYNDAYEDQALDPHRVANQWRAQGVNTPAFPPKTPPKFE